jgi:16S rRNA (cytidine1402-2'-O)-methyltransferase
MIFYEAPHKLPNTLKDLYSYFGDRKLTIVREITKIHEEVIRTTTKEAFESIEENPLKGEIVLVMEGKAEEAPEEMTLEDAVNLANSYVAEGLKISDAAKKAASVSGLKKNEIYRELTK